MVPELVLRKPTPGPPPDPAPGEVHVRPGPPGHEGRRDLASLVLEHGPQAFPRGPGPIQRIVVLSADPTLDDMVAATLLARLIGGADVPPAADALAAYTGMAREGLRPGRTPLEESLEGVYLAVRSAAGGDVGDPAVARDLVASWQQLAEHILRAAAEGKDPFTRPLFPPGPAFARERAFLAKDRDVYRHDVLRGERWLVHLPGGPPQAAALVLRRPGSLLFKHWSRADPDAPGGPGYLFLAVSWADGQWIFSTDPVQRLPIATLAAALQSAEAALDPQRAAGDPWFDGKPFGHTLVAAPRGGTALPERQLLGVVRRWASARSADGKTRRPGPWLVGAGVVAALLAFTAWWWPRTSDKERGLDLRINAAQAVTSMDQGVQLRPGGNSFDFRADGPYADGAAAQAWVALRSSEPLAGVTFQAAVNDGKLAALSASPAAESGGGDEREWEVKSGSLDARFKADGNVIRVIVHNPGQRPIPATLTLSWQLNRSKKGRMHLLCVGVSDYQDKQLNLNYADADARALAEALQNHKGELFESVTLYQGKALVNERATRAELLAALARVGASVQPGDLAVVTFSGHGATDELGQYYFLPHDFKSDGDIRATGLDWRHIYDYFPPGRGSTFIVLDTCHAGAVASKGLLRSATPNREEVREAVERFAKADRGVVVMAACRSKEKAVEKSEWGHGALTVALLEGLTRRRWRHGQPGEALRGWDGGRYVISLRDLDHYVTGRVRELSRDRQVVLTQQKGGVALDTIPIAVAGP